MIKTTKIPIICICNDRQSMKIRSLAGHCYDLRFQRPKVEQIRGAMMSVCFKEGLKIDPQALREIIVASGQDVRQVMHNLSLWSASDKQMNTEEVQKAAMNAKKHSKMVTNSLSLSLTHSFSLSSLSLSFSLPPQTGYCHSSLSCRVHLMWYGQCSLRWRGRGSSHSMKNPTSSFMTTLWPASLFRRTTLTPNRTQPGNI